MSCPVFKAYIIFCLSCGSTWKFCLSCGSTWKSILHHMTKFIDMWNNFTMSSNDKLFVICNMEQFVIASHYKIAPHDKFTMYAVFLWITLFWSKCPAVLSRFTYFCVEQKLIQHSLWSKNYKYDVWSTAISSIWSTSSPSRTEGLKFILQLLEFAKLRFDFKTYIVYDRCIYTIIIYDRYGY